MKNRATTSLVVVLAGTFLLGACGTGGEDGANGEHPEVTLTFSHVTSEQSAEGAGANAFEEHVESADLGLTVENHWNASLTPAGEELQQVSSGVTDIVTAPYTYDPQELPVGNWSGPLTAELPSYGANLGQLVGTASNSELFRSEFLVEEYEPHNAVPLSSWVGDYMYLMCNEPVTTLEEAQGKRIRTAGALWGEEFEALGMIPTSIASTEQYEALQRGVIDCTAYFIEIGMDFGLFEVAPHLMMVPFTPGVGPMLINADTHEQLSDEQLELVDNGMAIYHEELLSRTAEVSAEVFEPGGHAEDLGIEVHQAPELLETLDDHRSAVIDDMSDASLDALTEDEMQGLLDNYRSSVENWVSILEEDGFPVETPQTEDEFIEQMVESANPDLTDRFFDEFANMLVDGQ